MIDTEQLRELSERELAELEKRRGNRRRLYASETGLATLVDLLVSSGVFSTIDPTDQPQMGARNLAIGVLEDLGLLDRASIAGSLRVCLEHSPILPEDLRES